jgi:predicted MPP superfamily phosphohydrolase
MRVFFNAFLFLALLFVIDWYVFYGIRAASSSASARTRNIINYGYWAANVFFYCLVIFTVFNFSRVQGPQGALFKTMAGSFILLYVPKLVVVFFLLAEDVFRILRFFFNGASNMVTDTTNTLWTSRRQFISQTATALATIPFAGIVYGIIKGKYNFKVKKVELAFKDLPAEFNGLTITQISDIHSGSWDDKAEVERAVKIINEQKSDLIFFTGDLVNNRADEMLPWIDTLCKLKAPMGKFSIFGNHDYGDYTQWNSAKEKFDNLQKLKSIHSEIGFKLLLNENLKIEKNNSFIDLIGIENWGAGGFSKYGDFEKSIAAVTENSFRILLSHDPSHWEQQVMNHQKHVHLTLSGHTHGMQFGVELGSFKFSPVQLRYPRWAGLYYENEKYLYVNRGLGFLAFPGRVGIWPEITVFKLLKA